MNLFASCLLLSQESLEDFLEKMPQDRLLEYGTLVGVDRIVSGVVRPDVMTHWHQLIPIVVPHLPPIRFGSTLIWRKDLMLCDFHYPHRSILHLLCTVCQFSTTAR